MIKGKKGVSMWLSWVLLMVFVVILSVVIFDWMKGYTESSSSEMTKRVFNAEKCSFISISVSEIVEKNPQTLNIKVTNRNNLRINQIIFRLYSTDNKVYVDDLNITLLPNQTKTVELQKNGTIEAMDLIPVRFEQEYTIVCRDRMVRIKI